MEAASELLTLLTGGSAQAAVVKVLLAVCVLIFGLMLKRYLGILGADRRRPAERQAYDALRGSLAEGNMAPAGSIPRKTPLWHLAVPTRWSTPGLLRRC